MAMPQRDNDNRIGLREIRKKREEQEMDGSLRFIPARNLQIDHRYQRHPNQTHVNRIARDFRPQIFGTIDVSQRSDGTYWIINGQHRVSAILKMGRADTPIPCIVHAGLTYESEAMMFHLMNAQTRPMTPQEKLKGAIEAGDPKAMGIRESVEHAGFSLNLERSERSLGRIPGVGALTRIARSYQPTHLDDTLGLIAATWGTETGPRHTVIDAVAVFLSYYRNHWDRKRFISQLRRVDMESVFRDGRDVSKVLGITSYMGVLYKIVEHYNRGLQMKNRLPSIEEMRAINKIGKGRA